MEFLQVQIIPQEIVGLKNLKQKKKFKNGYQEKKKNQKNKGGINIKFKGRIKNLNNIVVSDPTYTNDVECRYEKENLNEKNWIVDLDIYKVKTKVDKYNINGIEFSLILKKNEVACNLEDRNSILYPCNTKIEKYDIGMDTACVALGINEHANEIIESQEEWQPPCSIRTGCDGLFGNVYEGSINNKISFLWINGYISKDMINENELFDYLKENFKITELVREDIDIYCEIETLKKGDKVEVFTCSVSNNDLGTTIIRNSDYKSWTEGQSLTIENPDGTIETTTLKSHDKLVTSPIQVEVLEGFFDYETGNHYKGKLLNEDLIKEFSNSSIVNFSEFDIIKLLEKSSSSEMEIQNWKI